jgi:cystathionine beta-lyase/cystathionine gamma-synthase
MSLVMPYDVAPHRPVSANHYGEGCLVRFSIGLESGDDLISDLAQALLKIET